MPSDNENEIRVNIKLDREVNEEFSSLIPRGNKSDVIRNLVLVAIHNLKNDTNKRFYAALLQKRVDIVPIKD